MDDEGVHLPPCTHSTAADFQLPPQFSKGGCVKCLWTSRWRCLVKRLDISTASVSNVVLACHVLHNICELQRDDFLPEWTLVEDHIHAYPGHTAHPHAQTRAAHQAVREAIMSILWIMHGLLILFYLIWHYLAVDIMPVNKDTGKTK